LLVGPLKSHEATKCNENKSKIFGQVKVEAIEKRVTGIGVSFQIKNPKELVAWYGKHLGLNQINMVLLLVERQRRK
jgi:putative transposon-encoded protein